MRPLNSEIGSVHRTPRKTRKTPPKVGGPPLTKLTESILSLCQRQHRGVSTDNLPYIEPTDWYSDAQGPGKQSGVAPYTLACNGLADFRPHNWRELLCSFSDCNHPCNHPVRRTARTKNPSPGFYSGEGRKEKENDLWKPAIPILRIARRGLSRFCGAICGLNPHCRVWW